MSIIQSMVIQYVKQNIANLNTSTSRSYYVHTETKHCTTSQAAWQGLAVLMATAVVVLKHDISTTYQSHIYESIDLKFG